MVELYTEHALRAAGIKPCPFIMASGREVDTEFGLGQLLTEVSGRGYEVCLSTKGWVRLYNSSRRSPVASFFGSPVDEVVAQALIWVLREVKQIEDVSSLVQV